MSTIRTAQRTLTEADGTKTTIVAHYGIRDNRVSVTGEVYYNHDDQTPLANLDPDKCGQVCDDIKQAFPWLGPLMELHLADAYTGAPMYALDNGWFWLHEDEADGPLITTVSRRRAARYLRTTPDMLEGVRTKNDLSVLINTTLAPAWKRQMDAALALYDLSTGHKPQINKDLESLQIIYTDNKGCLYTQPLSDLSDVGTLVNPDEDTDLTIVGYTIA
jgi:hypothetical protein